METRTRQSRRKINALVLLIAFTALLMMSSIYAWFSTQKDITLSNLKGTVNVAEGLEVSIDGEKWGNEIDLSQALTKQADRVIPSEMLPVSTDGAVPSSSKELPMMAGILKGKNKLEGIVQCNEKEASTASLQYPGYFAFDIYLKNTTKETTKPTALQLNENSVVNVIPGGKVASGIQNTVRVAFANFTGTKEVLADKLQVLGDYGNIKSVSIWEPNANSHVDYVVNNNNIEGAKFTNGQAVTTYGLKSTSTGRTILDIYAKDTYSEIQQTVKTNTADFLKATEGIVNLTEATTGKGPFNIESNKISKIRIYVWLEGGDVDCINYASHGGGIQATIGLIKDAATGPTKK